jgi:hypothetical protein
MYGLGMDIAQALIYLVLVTQVLLVATTIYFYARNKLRLFAFLGLGFLALLVVTVLRLGLADVDTGLYENILEAAAGLFFLAGVLSTI